MQSSHVLTLEELLAEEALAVTRLHIPAPDVEVRWTAVSELVDPAPFLEGGELVLTTGLHFEEWEQSDWTAYVERLRTRQVAAIGLAIGLTHRRCPAGLRRACREQGMNLVEVPRRTTFVSISRLVARLVDQKGQEAAHDALTAQRRLTAAAARGDGPRAIAQVLAESLGGAVLVSGLREQDSAVPCGPRPELLDPAAIDAEIARMRPHGLRTAAVLSTDGATTLIHPIGLTGRPWGYLVSAAPGRVGETQRGTVATAVALLGLVVERGRVTRDSDRRLRARALEFLLEGDVASALLVLNALQPEASPRGLAGTVVLLRASAEPDLLEEALAAYDSDRVLSCLHEGELVLVVSAADLARQAKVLARFPGLIVGAGEQVPPARLRRSYLTAGHALGVAATGSGFADWTQSVEAGALSLMERTRAQAFADTFLDPLAGPDAEQLLVTLDAFLRHHGAHAPIADELGIHRNTVRNRVHQIERALHRSLDDPQVRVDAWLALQARTSADRV